MKAIYLRDLKKESKKIINAHIEKYNKTESGFAKECGIHPAQMILYMRGERGLTVDSLEKIGRVICSYKK